MWTVPLLKCLLLVCKVLDIIVLPALVQERHVLLLSTDACSCKNTAEIILTVKLRHVLLLSTGTCSCKNTAEVLLWLDYFFNALNRAYKHFWCSFSLVAERGEQSGQNWLTNASLWCHQQQHTQVLCTATKSLSWKGQQHLSHWMSHACEFRIARICCPSLQLSLTHTYMHTC